MFERIVVAVDGSEPSKRALATACEMAQKFQAELHLVHSPQVETTTIFVGGGSVEIKPKDEDIQKAGAEVVSAARKSAAELGCDALKYTIGANDPVTDIQNCVEATGADLVVMGRRGLGGLGNLFLGSISQKVSHDTKCSCLTVS